MFIFAVILVLCQLANANSAVPWSKRGNSKKALALSINVERNDAKPAKPSVGFEVTNKNVLSRQKLPAPVNFTLKNNYALYSANLCLGSPCQNVQLQIDTGSSDLWVPGVNNPAKDYGYFNSNQSSSLVKHTNESFSITYGDNTGASGYLAQDKITITAETVLENAMFAIATANTAGQGICGIGYTSNQASEEKYDNLPVLLKKAGFIDRASYSLYLNAQNASTGELIFGAVDHAKYKGNVLHKLPTLKRDSSGNPSEDYVALFVNMTSIKQVPNTNLTQTAGFSNLTELQKLSFAPIMGAALQPSFINQTYPALIDSGTTLISAPTDFFHSFGSKYGNWSDSANGYIAPCETSDEKIAFGFGNFSINVPLSDLLYKLTLTDGTPYTVNGVKTCMIAVAQNTRGYFILGDVFLRSAYVYVDLEDNSISLAQVTYSNSSAIEFKS